MRRIDRRHLLPGAAAFAAALLVALLGFNAGADQPTAAKRGDTVELQLLGVSDFHGHLEPPSPAWAARPGWAPGSTERQPRTQTARSACTPATWSAPPP